MSKAKELLQAIISGEGYNEAFKAVMAEKISARLQEEKTRVAQSIFNEAKMCDCDSCEEDLNGKCAVCGGSMKNESVGLEESKINKLLRDRGFSDTAIKNAKADRGLTPMPDAPNQKSAMQMKKGMVPTQGRGYTRPDGGRAMTMNDTMSLLRRKKEKEAGATRMGARPLKKLSKAEDQYESEYIDDMEIIESVDEHNKHTELKLTSEKSRSSTRLLKGGKTQHVGTALYKGHKYTDLRQAEDGKFHAMGTPKLKADTEQGAVDLYHASKAGADARKVIEKQLASKDKSVSEGFDILDERELTPEELKKREKYVLSMKKNKADFEKRYGARAKEVMYATATKMAKGEMNDSVEIEEFLTSLDEKIEKQERVNYFKEPEDAKKAGKRYSDVANMLKAKRQKPIARPSNIINASYEEDEEQIEEALVGNQHKLDHDKDGKIESSDLKKLRIKKDISNALDKHIEDYNSGGMDADTLGSKTVSVQKMIAKKHGISSQEAIKHVNDHVDSKIEG